MSRYALLLFFLICCFPHIAAATPLLGTACPASTVGNTRMDNDNVNIIACLCTDASCSTYKWKSQSGAGEVGGNQTWQNVIANRAINVTYTNNTGKPIEVAITGACGSHGNGTFVHLVIDGLIVGGYYASLNGEATGGSASGIVPAGSSYYATYNDALCNISNWSELR